MSAAPIAAVPTRLDLRKTEGLDIAFTDGVGGFLPLATLRKMCPCAGCRDRREQQAAKPSRLTVLGDATDAPLVVESAELVGSYALRLHWTDGHGSGIYSFVYLRSLVESKS